MKTHKAVYAASLDPITNGHVNVIERMSPLYDELVVLVGVNYRKTYMFTLDERVNMAKAALAHLPNVTVNPCTDCYVVKQADSIGAQVILKGMRNSADLQDEQTLAEENRNICPHIETVWVPCLPNLVHVSSSMVKGHIGVDPSWEEQVARSVPAIVVTKLKEKFVLGKTRKHWTSLMSALGDPKGNEEIFEELVVRYGEPHRVHHVLEHIVNMLDELELISGLLVNKSAVKLAVWYHDSIYEPQTKDHPVIGDNELRSAYRLELDMKKLGLPEQLIGSAGELVETTSHTEQVSDPDAQFLVDLDLMIFGKSDKEFDTYETGIRKEYEWVPWSDFCERRSKILQSFLNRTSIYSTQMFRDRYESTARKNLEQSIKQLGK